MNDPSKSLMMNADTLRRTLRLIHCLQRERSPSSAPLDSRDFLVKARRDTDHAMMDCRDIYLGQAPIRLVLNKIRGVIDERRISSHRTLVCFTTLISAVLDEHVLKYTSKANAAETTNDDGDKILTQQNGFGRIKSHQNFMSMGSDHAMGMNIDKPGRPPRQRSQSSGYTMETKSEIFYHPAADFTAVSAVESFIPVKFDDAMLDTAPGGVPIEQAATDTSTSLSRLSSLLQLLSIFVRIKESTGKERASLYSMLASDHADGDFLIGDVVMEVENQRRLLEQLQHVRNHPLQNLVQELVLMSEDMQQVQNLLSSGCLIESMKQYYSPRQLYDVLTVYMDKLHSLELLIVEEVELALPVQLSEASISLPLDSDSTILLEAFGTGSPTELHTAIEAMSSEEVKNRLLAALRMQVHPVANAEEKRDEDVASTGVDELMRGMYGNVPAMKEWEIDIYEIKFLKRIGQGAGGTTYLAHWSGEDVAVKVASTTELGLDGFRTEVQALQKLHHPNIIRLLGSVYHQQPLTFCLVLEYCTAGDLSSALTKTVPSNFFFHVATSIAKGLVYLHHRAIIHRDIKPHNILLHGDLALGHYQVKLTDFGVAANLNDVEDRSPETGTYRWMSPEIIRHEPYTEKADVYSFAIILWQLLTHEEPFANLGQIEAAAVVAMEFARPLLSADTPSEVKNLVERCWAEDASTRPSFSEILLELNALKFDLGEEERKWLDAPLGHPVYKKKLEATPTPSPLLAPAAIAHDQRLKKKKVFGLFARKSSYF